MPQGRKGRGHKPGPHGLPAELPSLPSGPLDGQPQRSLPEGRACPGHHGGSWAGSGAKWLQRPGSGVTEAEARGSVEEGVASRAQGRRPADWTSPRGFDSVFLVTCQAWAEEWRRVRCDMSRTPLLQEWQGGVPSRGGVGGAAHRLTASLSPLFYWGVIDVRRR